MSDYQAELVKLWSGGKRGHGHGLCNNSGMAVLDMMETHGYTLLHMQHEGEGDRNEAHYIAAVFKKA